jgi:hypothetical protein
MDCCVVPNGPPGRIPFDLALDKLTKVLSVTGIKNVKRGQS